MNPSQAASRVSIESDAFVFHYLIEADVCYLTLTDRGYPKKLAYQYLEELQSEFSRLYGQQIESIARPYAFIKFGAAPRLRLPPLLTWQDKARLSCGSNSNFPNVQVCGAVILLWGPNSMLSDAGLA